MASIHHLALFICHLFVDGHFRTANFIYNSNVFEFNWILQIEAICPKLIPSYLVDLTLPWELPWKDKDGADNVLQLNFLDVDNFSKDFNQSQWSYTYYCVFCFPSTDLNSSKQRSSIFNRLHTISDSKILFVEYNTNNVSIFTDINYNSNEKSNFEPNFIIDEQTDFQQVNLFDRTFGEYERVQSIAIQRVEYFDKLDHGKNIKDWRAEEIWKQYYHMRLNNSIINMTWIDKKETPRFETNRQCRVKASDYYKELSNEYQCLAVGDSFTNDNSISIHVEPASYLVFKNRVKYAVSTYPYHSSKLKAIFVYGTDYRREFDIFHVSDSIKIVAALILSLLIVAILTLYAIRRRFELLGNDVGSVVVDCLIPFIGGGNLRMEHRFERWFFGILLIGAFFILSVFGGDLVDSVVHVLEFKVRTFEDVAKINPKIYYDPGLTIYLEDVHGILTSKLRSNTADVDADLMTLEKFKILSTSYLLIPISSLFDVMVYVLDYYKRDYDILEEPLGELPDRIALTSDQYISLRMIMNIEKAINSMAEHGFHEFYHSHMEFQLKHKAQNLSRSAGIVKGETGLESITIEQLRKPIIIVMCLNGIATIIFVAEILIFKWLKWRNCRVQILPIVEGRPEPQSMSVKLRSKRCQTAPYKRQHAKRCPKKRHSAHF